MRYYRIKQIYRLVPYILLFACLWSCDTRRPILEENYVWVRIAVDWQPAQIHPYGSTICIYDLSYEQAPKIYNTHYAKDSIRLPKGRYAFMVFNETTATHEGFHFNGLDRYDTAQAVVDMHSNASNPNLACSPDVLAVDSKTDVEITDYQIQHDDRPTIYLTPSRVTVPVTFVLHVHGVSNVAKQGSHASLCGMAQGIQLATKEPIHSPVTNTFDVGHRCYDEDSTTDGTMDACFNTFGLAKALDADSQPIENLLSIDLKLRNNEWFPTIERDATNHFEITEHILDVDDQIHADIGSEIEYTTSTHTGHAQIEIRLKVEFGLDTGGEDDAPIIIPYVEDKETGGSGFDADVDDWGENTNIPVVVSE